MAGNFLIEPKKQQHEFAKKFHLMFSLVMGAVMIFLMTLVAAFINRSKGWYERV